jgi:hypothetical protein
MTERQSSFLHLLMQTVRRNHAIEHATLNLLLKDGYRLSGLSDWRGFFVLGKVPTELLFNTTQRAVERLNGGDRQLAIHPHCGTNYASSGAVAGLVAWLVMAGANSGRKRWSRLPFVIAFSSLAYLLSQPLGPWLQKNVTTNAMLDEVRVTGILLREYRHASVHRVYLKHGKG